MPGFGMCASWMQKELRLYSFMELDYFYGLVPLILPSLDDLSSVAEDLNGAGRKPTPDIVLYILPRALSIPTPLPSLKHKTNQNKTKATNNKLKT